MIAVDTNILIRAHRKDSPRHGEALQRLTSLAEGDVAWGLPVFCMGEFLRVVTHRKIFNPPSSIETALESLMGLLGSPTVRLLSPGPRFPEIFAETIRKAQARGNLVFDAQIAALCLEHAVHGLLTLDRDFSLFPEIRVIKLEEPFGSLPAPS
ncbi:MAG: VapC toxin family PIN domain ribonuclease [Acidobacteria bacterium]|nr:MAG: VapC toxin family PIN domain ribonuclease [Acidobacteriota bacterium]